MTKEEKILEINKLSGTDNIVSKIRDQKLIEFFENNTVSEEEKYDIISFFVKYFSLEKFKPIISKAMSVYTDEEIDHLYNFYNSEIGLSILSKTELVYDVIFKESEIYSEEILKKGKEEYPNLF